ncbi:MAG: RNA polymerase subunit sigma-24 [Flavobacteriales bacterium]|nr:RNA polymerase subunit sigma-24 [Flavobacteriales bacterium]|tara:strand:- start:15234 stop:15821 length:588 start_codon:yes stop_codon:yes gene_type:complete
MFISKNFSDKDLVMSFINGDNSALAALIDKYRSRIFGFIISKVKNKEVAEDIFQETFIKVINNIKKGKYNEQGKFIVWVMTITHNLIMDYFRKQKKRKFFKSTDDFNVFDFIKNGELNVEQKLIKEQVLNHLKILINELPIEQKEILQMRYYSKMSYKEISENCGISINTALGRMRYAIINLRKIIKRKGVVLSQ